LLLRLTLRALELGAQATALRDPFFEQRAFALGDDAGVGGVATRCLRALLDVDGPHHVACGVRPGLREAVGKARVRLVPRRSEAGRALERRLRTTSRSTASVAARSSGPAAAATPMPRAASNAASAAPPRIDRVMAADYHA
jgi:hypothetical protein